MYILAGDIGGTKTLLGLFASAPRRPESIEVRRSETRADTSLEVLVDRFLAECGRREPISYAVFGVAGAVRNNRAQLNATDRLGYDVFE